MSGFVKCLGSSTELSQRRGPVFLFFFFHFKLGSEGGDGGTVDTLPPSALCLRGLIYVVINQMYANEDTFSSSSGVACGGH